MSEQGAPVPFRIRVGVTGHRALDEHDDRLIAAVREQIARVKRLLPASEHTPVKLTVVTALAEGGDRIVTREVLSQCGEEARLEVVIPLSERDYVVDQEFGEEARKEFELLFRRATLRKTMRGPWRRDSPTAGYEAAGRWIVKRADLVIALWDGRPARGRGGTAPTFLYAAELPKPCIWIPTEGSEPCRDNLSHGSAESFQVMVRERVVGAATQARRRPGSTDSTLGPMRESFENVDRFNRARVPGDVAPASSSEIWNPPAGVRAGELATRFQRRFVAGTWLTAMFATLAAASIGVGVTYYSESIGPEIAEIASLAALVVVFAYLRLGRLHQRWLANRFLAERIRTAGYVAATGVDARRAAEFETLFVEQSADWSARVFEEVWDSRPGATAAPAALTNADVARLSHLLADEWIDGQIAYHEKKGARHERHHRVLTTLVVLLAIGGILFPCLDAAGIVKEAAILLSITLPVAAGSLGAILTIRQHHALAARFRRMRNDLSGVRTSLLDADTPAKLRRSASEAARIVADEAGDWFGAMWFLDADHPT